METNKESTYRIIKIENELDIEMPEVQTLPVKYEILNDNYYEQKSHNDIEILNENEASCEPKSHNEVEVCRFCAEVIHDIPIPINDNKTFANIKHIFPFEVRLVDEFPKFICSSCNANLLATHNFIKNAVKADQFFREKKQFVCRDCGKNFQYENHLKVHMKSHDGFRTEHVIVCNFCGEVFALEGNWQKHSHKKVNNSMQRKPLHLTFRCEFCNKVFAEKEKLCAHWRRHEDNNFQCDVCLAKFSSRLRCMAHKSAHICEKKTSMPTKHFLCNLCDKSYQLWNYLRVHKRIKHRQRPVEPLRCKECKTEFPSVTSLRRHICESHNLPVICFQCGKIFVEKSALQIHRKKFHTNPNACKVCGLNFNSVSMLEAHELTHPTSVNQCSFCPKAFNYRYELRKHVRCRHSGNFTLLVDSNEDDELKEQEKVAIQDEHSYDKPKEVNNEESFTQYINVNVNGQSQVLLVELLETDS